MWFIRVGLLVVKINFSSCLDDVLESFLSEYREKRQHRQQKSSTEATAIGEGVDPFDSIDHSYSVTSSISTTATDTDWPPIPTTTSQQRDDRTSRDMEDSFDDNGEEGEGEGEGEYCFRTPEHPTGTELVVNLLSTWGDKFYIGLTGIEVYTSTGHPAVIAQVAFSSIIPSHCMQKNIKFLILTSWEWAKARGYMYSQSHS